MGGFERLIGSLTAERDVARHELAEPQKLIG